VTILDDLVPEPLQRWDSALLNRLRAEGKGETLFFEFKELFDCPDVEKAVCAFANRLGGFVLWGTTAKASDNTIDAFPGLEPGEDWIRRVSDCVVGHVSPLPTWDTVQIPSPDEPGRVVVAARVESSAQTPHLLARNGRIYLRNPGGSDPVTDKATIDALVARGTAGPTSVYRRADEIHGASPGAELLDTGAAPYVTQIVAVPFPPLGEGSLANLLTRSGRAGSGSIFTTPAVLGLKPIYHREDRVILVGGLQVAARYTDGTIFLRAASASSYLGVTPFADLIRGVLSASGLQIPPAHQVFLDVRVLGSQSRRLDEDGTGMNMSSLPLAVDLWQWTRLTGTADPSREQTAVAFGRRLWRAVGDPRGLEPE
jgi:hypothetical protein